MNARRVLGRRVGVAAMADGHPFAVRDQEIDAFYDRLTEGGQVATSQPSPGEFLEAYVHAAVGAHTGALTSIAG